MLDEPLGALDRALRDSLQGQIRTILKEVGVTSVYVTHDRDEAMAMADTLAFMDAGSIVQTGTPEEVFSAPANEFVARTIGLGNVFPGVVRSTGDTVEVECGLGVLSTTATSKHALHPHDKVMLIVDEAGVEVRATGGRYSGATNPLAGVVLDRTFRGSGYELRIRAADAALSASAGESDVRPGDEVTVLISPSAIRAVPLS
jgi:ABC-type Fe3+/spermidine/putrescine transport system ATPase subunit